MIVIGQCFRKHCLSTLHSSYSIIMLRVCGHVLICISAGMTSHQKPVLAPGLMAPRLGPVHLPVLQPLHQVSIKGRVHDSNLIHFLSNSVNCSSRFGVCAKNESPGPVNGKHSVSDQTINNQNSASGEQKEGVQLTGC